MKQFHETYKDNEKLSPLVAEIPWTNNLLIMTAFKTYEAKEFYLKACIENHYSKRELERQIDSMLYERTAISDAKHGQFAKRNEGLSALRAAYALEFLDLSVSYKEKDLRKQIVSHLKDFILEFRKGLLLHRGRVQTSGRQYRFLCRSPVLQSRIFMPCRRLTCSSLNIWGS